MDLNQLIPQAHVVAENVKKFVLCVIVSIRIQHKVANQKLRWRKLSKTDMQTITIYTTPTCHFCHGAKAFFKEHSIAYTEKDVSGNSVAREEMISKSGQMGVPVIDIDGKIVEGFDEVKLRELLGIKN